MRLLICADGFGMGGKERQVVELLKGLQRRSDVEVLVVCMDDGDFYTPAVKALGVEVIYTLRRTRWDPDVFRHMFKIVRRFRPDVIHTNGMVSSFYALPVAKWFRVPLVNGSIRNAFRDRDVRWRLERLLLSWSDVRVANSIAGLESRGFSPASSRNAVVHNGFDATRALPFLKACDAPAGEGDPQIVGMVAEFNRYKDHETFIVAAQRLLERRNDVRFVAVGDGETWALHKGRVAPGSTGIEFPGREKAVERVISTFAVGVLATFTEGLSNAIMEYMALGKPVVATDGGGSRELVREGETGFLVPPQDAAALADRIAFLLDHPDVARRMGQAGRLDIERRFSLETMIEKTVEVYDHARHNGGRRSA